MSAALYAASLVSKNKTLLFRCLTLWSSDNFDVISSSAHITNDLVSTKIEMRRTRCRSGWKLCIFIGDQNRISFPSLQRAASHLTELTRRRVREQRRPWRLTLCCDVQGNCCIYWKSFEVLRLGWQCSEHAVRSSWRWDKGRAEGSPSLGLC